jgi:cytosine/adenosine deaminase-related metal-dependent hydrolase
MAQANSKLLIGGTLLVHNRNDNVEVLRNTDLLIENNKIAKIEKNIQPPPDAQIIDCKDKIISPGFIDTHHHVWQTQLKGRHSDDTLLDYHPKGNLQYYNYTNEDVFWGELGGLLEAIDGGTTTIVDHAHMSNPPHHIGAGLSATLLSGIRSVFCYSLVMNIENWDENEMKTSKTAVPEWWFPLLDEVAKHPDVARSDRVDVGLGFDSYHLPEQQVKEAFERARGAGVKLITSHWRRNNIAGTSR